PRGRLRSTLTSRDTASRMLAARSTAFTRRKNLCGPGSGTDQVWAPLLARLFSTAVQVPLTAVAYSRWIGVGPKFLSVARQRIVTARTLGLGESCTSRISTCGLVSSTSTHLFGSSPARGSGPLKPTPLLATTVKPYSPSPG